MKLILNDKALEKLTAFAAKVEATCAKGSEHMRALHLLLESALGERYISNTNRTPSEFHDKWANNIGFVRWDSGTIKDCVDNIRHPEKSRVTPEKNTKFIREILDRIRNWPTQISDKPASSDEKYPAGLERSFRQVETLVETHRRLLNETQHGEVAAHLAAMRDAVRKIKKFAKEAGRIYNQIVPTGMSREKPGG